MIRVLLREVKQYKGASIATPLFMVLEVLMEVLVPGVYRIGEIDDTDGCERAARMADEL